MSGRKCKVKKGVLFTGESPYSHQSELKKVVETAGGTDILHW